MLGAPTFQPGDMIPEQPRKAPEEPLAGINGNRMAAIFNDWVTGSSGQSDLLITCVPTRHLLAAFKALAALLIVLK